MRRNGERTVVVPERLITQAEWALLEFDHTTTLRYSSPLAFQLLGTAGQAVLNASVLLDPVRKASTSRGTLRTRILNSDGQELDLLLECLRLGRAKRIVCLVRRAGAPGQAARDSSTDSLLHAIVEGCHDGLTIIDSEGVILYANEVLAQYDRLPREAVVGRSINEFLREGLFDHSVTLEVLATKVPTSRIQTLRDGRKLLVSGRPILGEDARLQHVVTTLRDVTELVRLLSMVREPPVYSGRPHSELRRLAIRDVPGWDAVAQSPSMRLVRERALQYAKVDSPVLLLGETGTGKRVIAKLLHDASALTAGPFVEVNCGAIPESLLEAELFGYVKGAFTGADPHGKVGLIEAANNGTLLLDEIGDLPLGLQAKLLTFLDTGEVYPVGAVRAKRPNGRIITATNRDLAKMVEERLFRRDLFYRLNVLAIHIPPLRERREDMPALVEMMLSKLGTQLQRRFRITKQALDVITRYSFPGNVRELWNLIERMVITARGETIDLDDIPVELFESQVVPSPSAQRPAKALRRAVEEFEAGMLTEALRRWRTQTLAARHLGVSQATIARKTKRYRLARAK